MRLWRRILLVLMALLTAMLVGAWTLPQFFMSGHAISLTSAYAMIGYYVFGTAFVLMLLLVLGIAVSALTIRIKLTEY